MNRKHERNRLIEYIRWHETPQGGMIPGDDESCQRAKAAHDKLCFDLAALDSGKPITVVPLFRGVTQCFGVNRGLDTRGHSTVAKKGDK